MKKWLVVSIVLNVLLLTVAGFIIYQNGGERFVKAQWKSLTSDQPFNEYYLNKKSIFEAAPDAPVDRAFVGDSLTDHGVFSEYFPGERVINRGIRDDTSYNVLHRIGEVAAREPANVHLLVGINDIMEGVDISTYEDHLREIVGAFGPETEMTLFSILPVNNEMIGNSVSNEDVAAFNRVLEDVAQDAGANYVDLWPAFQDEKGQLDERFTLDGVHLNGKGYDVLLEQIES